MFMHSSISEAVWTEQWTASLNNIPKTKEHSVMAAVLPFYITEIVFTRTNLGGAIATSVIKICESWTNIR
jgi:hypothetical protein